MNGRSNFILGKDFFIKIINISDEDSLRLEDSLKTGSFAPFSTVEFLSNYYISQTNREKIEILSPGTKVYVSSLDFNRDKIGKNLEYKDIENFLKSEGFIYFDKYLENPREIKTAVILSKRLKGNLDDFLKTHYFDEKALADAFIHISYLFFMVADKYKAIHGDSKTGNFTWMPLDKPIDIEYKFSNNKEIIIRKNVKHLFFFTDLEFFHAEKTLSLNGKYYNFTKIYSYLDDNRPDIYYVPKISRNFGENYANLFGGYLEKNMNISSRMFVKALFSLFQMIITYGYSDFFPQNIIRKLNMYFTRFISLSFEEEDIDNRYKVDYSKVSAYSLADLFNA